MGAPPSEANPAIAQALRRARRWRGVTQEALAALLRESGATTATNTVQRWERTGSIKLDDAMLLASTYRITLEQLAGREPLPDTFEWGGRIYRAAHVDHHGEQALSMHPIDDVDPEEERRLREAVAADRARYAAASPAEREIMLSTDDAAAAADDDEMITLAERVLENTRRRAMAASASDQETPIVRPRETEADDAVRGMDEATAREARRRAAEPSPARQGARDRRPSP